MSLIKNIHICEDGEIRLRVVCPECSRSILINEDTDFCPLCFKEIEWTNINAWMEYINDVIS